MHGAWSGSQYDQLTDILIETQKTLSKQSNNLIEYIKKYNLIKEKNTYLVIKRYIT